MSAKKNNSAVKRIQHAALLTDIRQLIEETRSRTAVTVNAALTILYWRIGKRLGEEVLKGERAEYGQEILATVSQTLTGEYGRGFAYSALTRMIRFAETFPDRENLATLSHILSWSHFCELLPLEKPYQREFYTEMCHIERWSVRELRRQIDSMLYERTVISRKPEEVIRHALETLKTKDTLSPDLVFRDPYVLDFLGLADRYLERDLEDAILREMEAFLLELGIGFTFVARQKRIQIDSDDYFIDLLFFNRKLRRMVVVELKMEKFKPEHKGQMELYLRWLDRYEREDDEHAPVGIILCAGKSEEQIELLELDRSGIHVAEYLTELPSPELLKRKLNIAVRNAQARLAGRAEE